MVPARYTCDGRNISPPLRWSHVPPRTRSFALRLDDPDAPGGTFTHWTAWNFVAGALALRAGAARHWRLSGTNSFGRIGYSGPCPPPGPAHHYVFRLYALDTRLALRRGASTGQFSAALRGHVVATARLVGRYGR
jgi:Raf kinase inhibitor-like YbhB/YbcL family protein